MPWPFPPSEVSAYQQFLMTATVSSSGHGEHRGCKPPPLLHLIALSEPNAMQITGYAGQLTIPQRNNFLNANIPALRNDYCCVCYLSTQISLDMSVNYTYALYINSPELTMSYTMVVSMVVTPKS